MALRCLERQGLVESLWTDWQVFLEQDFPKYVAANKRKRNRDDKVFWEIKKTDQKGDSKKPVTATAPDENSVIEDQLQTLSDRLIDGITECQSRIEHFARAAIAELVRGFFLPLLTVLTGCVARIRVLLQRIQTQISNNIQHHVLLKYSDDRAALTGSVRQRLTLIVETINRAATTGADSTAVTQKYQDGRLVSRAQLTVASLRSLGITSRDVALQIVNGSEAALSTQECETTDYRTVDSDENNGNDDDSKPIAAAAAAAASSNEPPVSVVDDSDLGESVGGAMLLHEEDDRELLVASQHGSYAAGALATSDGIDQNTAVMERLKEKRGTKTDKKQKKKRKTGDKNSSSKSKKKEKKGDFFDKLFG